MGIFNKLLKKVNKVDGENKKDFNKKAEMLKENMNGFLNINMQKNIEKIKKELGNATDLVIRDVSLGEYGSRKLALIYIDGLVNDDFINSNIMTNLMIKIRGTNISENLIKKSNPYNLLKYHLLTASEIIDVIDYKTLYLELLGGGTIILQEGVTYCISVDTRGWSDRGIQESTTEQVIKGPKESFNETLRTNTALIRRKIKDKNLRVDSIKLGSITKTDIAMVYINGIVNEKLLIEVRERLNKIKIDGIFDSAYIEEHLKDKGTYFFPTVFYTERPDLVGERLLEGRIAIIIDGTPFVLLLPTLFVDYFKSYEDYYQGPLVGTFFRILRYFSFIIALLAPALYVTLSTYNISLIPTVLLINLIKQRQGVPLPSWTEAIFLGLLFEIFREATIRLPKMVANSIIIVGALIINETAVAAGIVSEMMLIITSLTALSGFVFTSYDISNRILLLRYIFIFIAVFLGMYGIVMGLLCLLLYLNSLSSIGVPYMYSLSPTNFSEQKDTIIRISQNKKAFNINIFNRK